VECCFWRRSEASPWRSRGARPGTPVFEAGRRRARGAGSHPRRLRFQAVPRNGKPKKVLAISGGQVMHNVKIVAVTSPQLYEELRRSAPAKAAAILSDEERQYVVALHNGWPGFLYPFVMPGDYQSRVFGMDRFSRSGKPDEIYRNAGFDCEGLRKKILSSSTSGAGTNRRL